MIDMKKILYFATGLLFAGLLTGCDVNDKFDSLDEITEPKNVAAYTYKLTDADYVTISNLALAANSEDAENANYIKTYLAFSDRALPSDYIPLFLANKYKFCDDSSTATITYTYGQVSPEFSVLGVPDYQVLWGDNVMYVEAFSPSKSVDANIDDVLKAKYTTSKAGDYKLIGYNYSATDPIVENIDYKYFFDTFESFNALDTIKKNGWIHADITGTTGGWICKSYNSNKYAQITSKNTAEKNDVYLIHQVDLTLAIAPQFTFDVTVAYWNANCLTIKISEDFNGNVDGITSATWNDITSSFTLPETPTSGYGTLANAGTADLTAYKGKKVYIAFIYSGDATSTPALTTTYQIDNVKVSEMRDAMSISSSERMYAAYNFDGSSWTKSDETFDVIQDADYAEMGVSYISTDDVSAYIPNYLRLKYPYAFEGNTQNVVYKSNSNGTVNAIQFIYEAGVWTTNDFAKEESGMFKLFAAGWKSMDTDILIGLNSATKNGSNLGPFSAVSVSGDQIWKWDDSYTCMKMSGYSNGSLDNEDWLISPKMNFSKRNVVEMTFDHTGKFFNTMSNEATLWVSTDYTGGSPSSATWTQLTIPTYMSNNNYTFVSSGSIDLSVYAGSPNVRIAFKYISTTSFAGTWEVKNVYVHEIKDEE